MMSLFPSYQGRGESLQGVRKPQVNHTFLCQSRTTTARYISLPLTLLYKLFSRDLIKTATGSTSIWRNTSSSVAEVNPLLLSCRMSKSCTRRYETWTPSGSAGHSAHSLCRQQQDTQHQGGGLMPAVPVYAKHIHVRGGGSCRAHSCVTGNQCDK